MSDTSNPHTMSADTRDGDPPTFDPESETYRIEVEPSGDISMAAIMTIAQIEETDPMEMEPSYDGHNLDLIDSLGSAIADEEIDVGGHITVSIADYRVTLQADGTLIFHPP